MLQLAFGMPSQTTASHRKPPRAIANNSKPSQTTASVLGMLQHVAAGILRASAVFGKSLFFQLAASAHYRERRLAKKLSLRRSSKYHNIAHFFIKIDQKAPADHR
jgi:hypothetical protein